MADEEDFEADVHLEEDEEDDGEYDEEDEDFEDEPNEDDLDFVVDDDEDYDPSKKKKSSSSSAKKPAKAAKASKGKGAPKRKKRKEGAALFIEDEVEEGDDEEEELEAEEGFVDHEPEAAESSSAGAGRQVYRSLQRLREEDPEVAARRFEAEAAAGDVDYEEGLAGAPRGRAGRQATLPTIRDPPLYLVHCRPGKEREIVLEIMQRWTDDYGRPADQRTVAMGVICAIAIPTLKGCLYIESESEQGMRAAIKDCRNVLHSRPIRIVPVQERSWILDPSGNKSTQGPTDPELLKPGRFVRLKRGVYKGDLARIIYADLASQLVAIKVIPRWPKTPAAGQEEGRKRGRGPNQQEVGEPRFFKPDDPSIKPEDLTRRHEPSLGDVYYWNNRKYAGGYLIKNVRVVALDVRKDLDLRIDEVANFFIGGLDAMDDDAARQLNDKKRITFKPGDVVRVTEGDLINLTGIVESIGNNGEVKVKPAEADLPGVKELILPGRSLVKFFKVGEHVKILSGDHEGETGVVIKVEGDATGSRISKATVFTDVRHQEVLALMSDLQTAAETSAGKAETSGKNRLFDLIQLPEQKSAGVIVDISGAGLKVLDTEGKVSLLAPQQIGRRLTGKFHQTGTDSEGKSVATGDSIIIKNGPLSGIRATVKHIFKHFIFVQSTQVMENGGMLVAQSRNINLASERDGPRPSSQLPAAQSPFVRPGAAARGGFRGGRSGPSRQDQARIGKQVVIVRGPYKSYVGVVKAISNDSYQVELQANDRKMLFKASDLSFDGEEDHTPKTTERPLPPQTPHRLPPRTPMRDDSSTPGYYPPMTPSHDPWNPASLATPKPYSSSQAPSPYTSLEPKTPGSHTPYTAPTGSTYYTPATAYSAPTPGSNYTSGATAATPGSSYETSASTPYAGYTPSTPSFPKTPGSGTGGY